MKKWVIWALLLFAVGALLRGYRSAQQEIVRLRENHLALTEELHHYQTRLGDSAASSRVLRLRCREYEQLRARDAAEIRSLGIRLKRAEAVARADLATRIDLSAPLHDTLLRREKLPLYDTVRLFRWRDPWIEVEGVVAADSVQCRVRSVDTLLQVVHRVPRRFLFIRWGTKAIRQEIINKNPHTRVVYAEYIALER